MVGRGGPRDLAAIRIGLQAAGAIAGELAGAATPPTGLAGLGRGLGHHVELIDRLGRAITQEPPLLVRDGGFIAAGYHAELDELRTLRDDSRRLILALEARYRTETGVASLKIRHNNVLGYYVETTPVQADKLDRKSVV